MAALRALVASHLLAEFDIDEQDIAGSYDAFARRAAPILRAGKASVQDLATAYIAQFAELETGRPAGLPDLPDLSERSAAGSLREAFAPLGSIMLGSIASGRSAPDALAYGEFLVSRLSDTELLSTRDETVAANSEAATTIVGWEGIIEPNACDECVAQNSGTHDVGEELYRHGNCGCDSRPVFASD